MIANSTRTRGIAQTITDRTRANTARRRRSRRRKEWRWGSRRSTVFSMNLFTLNGPASEEQGHYNPRASHEAPARRARRPHPVRRRHHLLRHVAREAWARRARLFSRRPQRAVVG